MDPPAGVRPRENRASHRRLRGLPTFGFIMQTVFESPFKGITLDRLVTNPKIRVGRHSTHSGDDHGHGFDDCARFLLAEEGVDTLVIGSFCSIGSGAAFIMAGNQGHRTDWISTVPFFFMPDVPSFAGAENGTQPAGDTVVGHDVRIGSEAIVMPGRDAEGVSR